MSKGWKLWDKTKENKDYYGYGWVEEETGELHRVMKGWSGSWFFSKEGLILSPNFSSQEDAIDWAMDYMNSKRATKDADDKFDKHPLWLYDYELKRIFNKPDVKSNVDRIRDLMADNIESGFAVCKSGDASPVITGTEGELQTGTEFEEFCRARNSEVFLDTHSHPSGIATPTIADMVNLAEETGKDGFSCIVTRGEIKCYRPTGDASYIAEKLKGGEDIDTLYNEMGRELSTYGNRWRSYDTVDKNVEEVRIE